MPRLTVRSACHQVDGHLQEAIVGCDVYGPGLVILIFIGLTVAIIKELELA